jgi:nitrogen fixation/metabolism regulation signal transduction histidine kinase
MVFRRFTIEMFIRFAVLLATLALLSTMITETSYYATTFLLILAAIIQIVSLIHYVDRTNAELTRFLNGIRYNDFVQSFSIEHLGSSFADLNEAFDDIMTSFREARSEKEQQARYLSALLEHIPVALLVIHNNGKVDLLNNASRRLLDAASIKNIETFHKYGAAFQRDIAQARAGETKLTHLQVDGVDQHVIISTTQITVAGDVQKVISLQDIQSQLDATELSAWQDLVRVISHEIMNSITPIASLARTASGLVGDIEKDSGAPDSQLPNPQWPNPQWEDAREAIQTVARRSEGLMDFVQSYKRLTQMPPPKMKKIQLSDYLGRLENLMTSEWKDRNIKLTCSVDPQSLEMAGDAGLIDQAVINLLRNAADACAGAEAPEVWLAARISARGKAIIEVSDNGPGIDPDKAEKIFMPFFTTKASGSGVGLSLVRKIMLVHSGSITAGEREGGGARFRLTF